MAKQVDFIQRKLMVAKEVERLQAIVDSSEKELKLYEDAKPPMVAMAASVKISLKRQRTNLEMAQKRYAELNTAVKP